MLDYYIDRMFAWGYIVGWFGVATILSFIIIFLLYMFSPRFEKFFDKLIKQ